ncbi:MAG: hypothetical protein RL326_2237 [Pseudomonadota bacterium]
MSVGIREIKGGFPFILPTIHASLMTCAVDAAESLDWSGTVEAACSN